FVVIVVANTAFAIYADEHRQRASRYEQVSLPRGRWRSAHAIAGGGGGRVDRRVVDGRRHQSQFGLRSRLRGDREITNGVGSGWIDFGDGLLRPTDDRLGQVVGRIGRGVLSQVMDLDEAGRADRQGDRFAAD